MRRILVAAALGAVVCSAGAGISVSGTGQANYQYPIAVPPGVAGMVPQLALQYAGAGINGPLGHGWSIQGISTITRCAADRDLGEQPSAVAYKSTDHLCLDGQRLIPTDESGVEKAYGVGDAAGLSGTSYREYRTSVNSFTRVRAYGAFGDAVENGPLYFKAWTKAGQVYEYGRSPSRAVVGALVPMQGGSGAMLWAVNRISDHLGNFMNFNYAHRYHSFGSGPSSPQAGLEWNIVSVDYSGKTGAQARAPYNSVVFDYVDRDDVPGYPRDRMETYHLGSKNVNVSRLRRIRSFVGINQAGVSPVLVRTLMLDYDKSPVSGRSRLTKHRECFGESSTTAGEPGAKCLPWASFTYADTGAADLAPVDAFNLKDWKLSDTEGNYGVLVNDFNGDGLPDILRWSAVSPDENQLLLNRGGGLFGLSALTLAHKPFTPDGCFYSIVADMNADGLPDILRFAGAKTYSGGDCPYAGRNFANIFKNDGKGAFTPSTVMVLMLGATTPSVMELARVKSNAYTKNFKFCPDFASVCYGWTEGATFYIADLNADGRPDIVTTRLPALSESRVEKDLPAEGCHDGTVCTHVYLATASGVYQEVNSNVRYKSLYSPPGVGGDMQSASKVEDFDGDGLRDLINISPITVPAGKYLKANWRNLGDGNFESTAVTSECERPLDFNGDGRADCLAVVKGDPTKTVLSVSKGNGSDTVAQFNLSAAPHDLLPLDSVPIGSRYGHFMLDANGDGRTDILRWHDDPALNRLYFSNGDGTFGLRTPASYLATRLKSSDGKFDVIVADFNGDGTPGMLRLSTDASSANGDAAKQNQLLARANPGLPDRLLSHTSSSALKTDLAYSPMIHQDGGRYQSDRGVAGYAATYPFMDFTPTGLAVTTVTTDTGVGGARKATDYMYLGMKVSVNGTGTSGYRAQRVMNLAPDGQTPMTTETIYWLTFPYEGMARQTMTQVATLTSFATSYAPTSYLSYTRNTYCDGTSSTSPTSAIPAAPCATTARITRPYLYRSEEMGKDLDGTDLPRVITVNQFNEYGDATSVAQTITGNVGGVSTQYTKTTTSVYETAKTDAENWILGRLSRVTVSNVVPDLQLNPSAGTAPNAAKTTGVGLP